jgi:hypothetical protein
MDSFPPAMQREALAKFATALGASDNSLKLDKCRGWHIAGKSGHVFAYAKGRFQIFVFSGARQAWTFAKKALAFARLGNDGDDEGAFFLDRLPTKSEASAIRSYCSIHKRPSLSAARRADRDEMGRVLKNIRLAA